MPNPILRTTVTLKINQAGVLRLFGPGSRAANFTKEKAEQILEVSRGFIGVEYSGQHPEHGGHLKDAGQVLPVDDDALSFKVTYKHPIALIHHEGSRPHSIGREGLLLHRDGRGAVVTSSGDTFFESDHAVHHPGTRGNPYLVDAAREVGLTVRKPSFHRRQNVIANLRIPLNLQGR